MSTRTVTRAPSRATYAELTHVAGRRLARALVAIESRGPREPRSNGSAAAYRDLADALAHLGSRLVTPIPRVPASGRSTRVRRGPDTHLLASLREVAQARNWDHPHPVEGIAADLDRAAVLLRAAADLWATHHTPDGHPRSIEGSRMRHPATLGAALREWRWMVTLSAALAGALADHGSVPNLPADPDDHRELASFPLPAGGMARAGTARAGTARRPPQPDTGLSPETAAGRSSPIRTPEHRPIRRDRHGVQVRPGPGPAALPQGHRAPRSVDHAVQRDLHGMGRPPRGRLVGGDRDDAAAPRPRLHRRDHH